MTNQQDILAIAQKRAEEKDFPYSGSVTPREAFALLQADPRVILIDVRSRLVFQFILMIVLTDGF